MVVPASRRLCRDRLSDRRLSRGCVGLEHADQLYRWLFQRPLSADIDTDPQERVELPSPVPVYILGFSTSLLH